MRIKPAFVCLLLLLSGCANTNVSSFVDPEFANERYKKPIVLGKISPLEHRQKLEAGIVEKFRIKGINAILGTTAFPPTREITEESLTSIFSKTESDSLLVISLKEESSIYRMKYEATLYSDNYNKVWIGSVVTNLREAGFSEDQTNDAVFDSTTQGIVDKIMEDGVIGN